MFEDLLSNRGLSLDRLKNFCAIAEAGGISKAADGDPARQSLYSRQIRELEEFFEVELTRRKGKGIELTEAGRHLARAARAHLQGLADFRSECRSQPTEYRIGGGNSVLEWLLIPMLPAITAAAPRARFNLLHMRTASVIRALSDHTVDFGIVRKSVVASGLRFHPLRTIGYSLFVPKKWVKRRMKAEDYLQNRPVAVSLGGEFLTQFTSACEEHGLNPMLRFNCATFTHVAALLQTGQAVAVLPDMAGVSDATRIECALLKGYQREMGIAWNQRLLPIRPKAEAVLDAFRKTAKN
jgi:DNA-binding transcriptional LysR family regulator